VVGIIERNARCAVISVTFQVVQSNDSFFSHLRNIIIIIIICSFLLVISSQSSRMARSQQEITAFTPALYE